MATAKNSATEKAATAAKAQKVGTHVRAKKIYTSLVFRRPKTLILPKNPKYARTAVPHRAKLNNYNIIKAPLFTDASMKNIEKANTITFLCDPRANKHHIRAAVKALYNVDVVSVNTLIRPDGQKKAFCRLPADVEAINVAHQAGLV